MIEDRSYGKAELAMLYFPTATPRVALNRLVRWINRCPELKQSLCSGYAGKFSHFYTRQQVAEIINFFAKNAVSIWFPDQNTYFKFGRSVQSRCRLAGFTKNLLSLFVSIFLLS